MKHAPLIKLLAGTALALAVVSSPAIASDSQSSKDKKEQLYPNAVRKEPKLDLSSSKEQKAINDGLAAVSSGDKDKATELLQPVVDHSKSKYAQALALQGLANLAYNNGDTKGAITLLKRSLDDGVMPNETYFQLEYELAQFYLADEQYQQVISTVEDWRAQGKREWADSYALEGNAYYRLQKYPEAIAAIKKAESLTNQPKDSWNQILMASYSESGQSDQVAQMAEQQLAKDPNDSQALDNALAALVQAQKLPDAIQLLEKVRAQGGLKESKNYVLLAKLYVNAGQQSDNPKPDADKAVQVLQEGISKGVVTPSYESYSVLGNAAYIAQENDKALDAYRKAIPLATDGEAGLMAGQILLDQNKYADARSTIQQAIDKGVKHRGSAYMMLAEANRGLKDKAGTIAAMKMAAQDPETAAKAKAWLAHPTVSQ